MEQILKRVRRILFFVVLTAGILTAVPAAAAALKEVNVPDGTYQLRLKKNLSRVVTVKNGGTGNGTRIVLSKRLTSLPDYQVFKITRLSNGWYSIVDANSGKALHISGSSKKSGARVMLYKSSNAAPQRWKFYSAGSGTYYIRNQLGNYLSPANGKTVSGTEMQVRSLKNNPAWKWKFTKVARTVKATKVTLSASKKTLKAGYSFTLEASVTPSNASDKSITWKSFNTSVAVVDQNGLVTAKAAGTAAIMATTSNGKLAYCTVTVKAAASSVSASSKSGTKTVTTICSALQNDSSLGLSDSKRNTVVVMARVLLNNGYEPSFVAGVLANILSEGAVGLFESSNYISSPEPQYLLYMDQLYAYRNTYSGKCVTEVSLSKLSTLMTKLKNNNWQKGKFGLGCVQWTGSRTYDLVQLYIKCANGNDRITFSQAAEAESRLIIYELKSEYTYVYDGWKQANPKTGTEAAAYDAGSRFCLYYEIPSDRYTRAVIRGNLAKKVYKVMMS